jgi:hypothetical protein
VDLLQALANSRPGLTHLHQVGGDLVAAGTV